MRGLESQLWCIYIYIYIYMHMYICKCVYVYIYVCVYVYVHMYGFCGKQFLSGVLLGPLEGPHPMFPPVAKTRSLVWHATPRILI